MSNIFIIFRVNPTTKSIKLFLFVIFVISSATNFVINPIFAQENGTNSTNSTSTNSTKLTNSTIINFSNTNATNHITTNSTGTNSTNSTSTNSTNSTSTNSTNSTSTNSTKSTNSTIINFSSTNATSHNTNSTNYPLNANSTTINSGNNNLTNANSANTAPVQPLIIVPSNSKIPLNNTTAPVVQYDLDTIHNAVAAEINIQNRTINTTSIDNSVSVSTSNSSDNSVKISVSAPDQTGPKVILFNLDNTTINVGNLAYLGVMFDGKQIEPAADVDAILHAKSTDNPHFAIIITQTGAQILVLVPHFSTHVIEITNLKAVTTTVPEFGPIAIMIIVLSMTAVIIISRGFRFSSFSK